MPIKTALRVFSRGLVILLAVMFVMELGDRFGLPHWFTVPLEFAIGYYSARWVLRNTRLYPQ